MDFTIVGDITDIETFAAGKAIREIGRLRKRYGRGRWRKRKGIVHVVRGVTSMRAKRQFVLCLRNTGYEVSLERHKIYRILSDREAARHDQLRVVDESGEDYLYPANYFARIELPERLQRAVLSAV